MHIPRRFALGEFWPLDDLINTQSRLVFLNHVLRLENDTHEILGVVLPDETICAVGGREDIVLQLDAIPIGIAVVDGNRRSVIDGPIRLDADDLQALIVGEELA